MGYFIKSKHCLIVKRHLFLLLFHIIKFIWLVAIGGVICYIADSMIVESSSFKTTLYIIGIAALNYWFFKFTLWLIKYYNNLIIVGPEQIIIIKSTLLLQDKIESLDSFKIMKLDSISQGFFSNIFGYGNLVIEQHNDELRTFHFIPKPYKVVSCIKKQKKKDKIADLDVKWNYDTIHFPDIV